jgi:ABC-type branched-subunit amino acid transport system permease subunit
MSHMMTNGCGVAMMLLGGLGMLLGLALVASLIVLIWVVIGRLRREPMVPPPGRS